jgi:hypothetical protein
MKEGVTRALNRTSAKQHELIQMMLPGNAGIIGIASSEPRMAGHSDSTSLDEFRDITRAECREELPFKQVIVAEVSGFQSPCRHVKCLFHLSLDSCRFGATFSNNEDC